MAGGDSMKGVAFEVYSEVRWVEGSCGWGGGKGDVFDGEPSGPDGAGGGGELRFHVG